MRSNLHALRVIILSLFASASLLAQNPVKWSFTTKDAGNCQVDLILTGTINDGYYTYSQFLESEDGPVATTLTFSPGANYKLIGKAKESGGLIKVEDKVFGMTVSKFKHTAVFTQRIAVSDPKTPVTGYITYMVCNDEMCLPPGTWISPLPSLPWQTAAMPRQRQQHPLRMVKTPQHPAQLLQ